MTLARKLLATAGAVAGGTTTYVEEDFTLTTSGDLSDNNLAVDELGGGWQGLPTNWTYVAGNAGVNVENINQDRRALVQTDGRENVKITMIGIPGRNPAGSERTAPNMQIRSANSDNDAGLVVGWYGPDADLDLVLGDGRMGDFVLLETWDLSALITTAPAEGDTVEWVVTCNGDDITLVSVDLNGGGAESINSTYTLTGTTKTNHGVGSGADWYGIVSNERTITPVHRLEYFKCESL